MGTMNDPLESIMSFATNKTMILSIQCLYKQLYSYKITLILHGKVNSHK